MKHLHYMIFSSLTCHNNKVSIILKHCLVIILAVFININNGVASTAKTGMRAITPIEFTKDMGAGWNLGNTMDAHGDWASGLKTETMWGRPKTTKAMIDAVKQQGFNTMRLPVTWYQHIGSAPNYVIDAAWLNRVEEVMNYAFDNNMYVILNTHHEEWLIPDSAHMVDCIDQLTKIWIQLANRFIDYGDYLIFEAINEPRIPGGTNEWSGGTEEGRNVVNAYNKAAVDSIRATGGNNADRFIMCPTFAASSATAAINGYVIPNNDSKVLVSIHSYSPYNFCQNTSATGTDEWGSDQDKLSIDNEMQKLWLKFIDKGHPVVMGEWGAKDKDNASARAVHAGYYVKAAKANKICPVLWDDGGNFEQLMRTTLVWKYPIIVNAIKDNIIGDTSSSGSLYQFKKRNAINYAIDGGVGAADGQNIFLWAENLYNGNQQWKEISIGGGYYSYQKHGTNYCIDGGDGGANGQNVALLTCAEANQNQHWKKVSAGSGNFRLEKRNASSFSIDGGNGGGYNKNLYLWTTNHSNQNQHWQFTAIHSIN